MGSLTKDYSEINVIVWSNYYRSVLADYSGLKDEYPFSHLFIPPTSKPGFASISVIAVNNTIIKAVEGGPKDFLGEYSKLIYLEIPLDYQQRGCKVFGCGWVDCRRLRKEDLHFFKSKGNKFGYQMCVGVPESFSSMKNVLLEVVKTADNMLVAYERVQRDPSKRLILNAYAHGDVGREAYQKDKKRYVSR